MSDFLTEKLAPLALWFRSLGTPEAIVHWGHPLMMAIVIFVMGTFVGIAGWKSRILRDKDKEAALVQASAHRKLAPWMSLFLGAGYTGGILSLLMQEQPILESPHFWTGSIILACLAINGSISLFGFKTGKPILRTVHAYLGTVTLGLLFFHALLGLKLGLSI